MSLAITSYAVSHRGSREHNEDSYANEDLMAGRCAVVADGAGGHQNGDIASRVTVDTVLLNLASARTWSEAALVAAIDAAGTAVRQSRDEQRTRSDMASTVAVLCIDTKAPAVVWAHLGDTRILFFRRGATTLLTRDHSIRQSFVDASLIPDDAPDRGPNRSALYAAVGAEGETRPRVGLGPAIEEGDAFLLCSDGVWDTVNQASIATLLARAGSVQQWIESIETALLQEAKPEQDNYTAIGLWVRSGDSHLPPPRVA